MHMFNKALIMGLMLTSLAVSQDGDPDSEEVFAVEASGPQLPQLMQEQPVAPIGLDAAAAPCTCRALTRKYGESRRDECKASCKSGQEGR